MRHPILLIVALLSLLTAEAQTPYQASVAYNIVDGVIILDEPEPAAGQQTMLEFRCAPLDIVRIGFVGLGMRGPSAVERFTYIDGVAINGLCDKYVERAERCQEYLRREIYWLMRAEL